MGGRDGVTANGRRGIDPRVGAWAATDYRRIKGIGRMKGAQLTAMAQIARRMMTGGDQAIGFCGGGRAQPSPRRPGAERGRPSRDAPAPGGGEDSRD
jgi:hypothetical protein